MLSILKAPKISSLARKRSQARNLPSGKRRCRGTSADEPKHIEPTQQIKEYKNEPFTVSSKKLFCKTCREEMNVKTTVSMYNCYISGVNNSI